MSVRRAVAGVEIALAAAVAAMGIVAAGCEPMHFGNAFNPTAEFVDLLRQRAEMLARDELERFNKSDLQYKNVVNFYRNTINPFAPNLGVYVKMYRDFTGYELVDIRRSESLLTPISIEIVYHYDAYTTPPHHNEEKGRLSPEQMAEEETEFSIRASGTIHMEYPCDTNGELAGEPPAPPPMDSYYELGGKIPRPTAAVPPLPGGPPAMAPPGAMPWPPQ